MRERIRESLLFLSEHPTIVRIAFFLGGIMNIYGFVSLIIKVNNVMHYKYEVTSGTFTYFNQIVDFFIGQGLGLGLLVLLLVGFVGYVILYPLSISMMMYYADTQEIKVGKSFGRYFSVVMLEGLLSLITFGTWHVQLLTWLYIMDILFDPFMLVIVCIIGLIVLVCTVLFPFSEYFLLLQTDETDQPEQEARAAMEQSARLVIDNFGTTVKYSLIQMLLKMRYILNIVLVLGLPVALLYILMTTRILSFETSMWIATSLGGVLLVFVVYIDSLLDAFFLTFWYKAFRELTGDKQEEGEKSE